MSSAMPALSLRVNAPAARFSATVMLGNTSRFSGTSAMPDSTMRRGAALASSRPSKRTAARLQDAGHGHHQRRLARAVGAEQARDRARLDLQRDALQGLDLAVGGDDV